MGWGGGGVVCAAPTERCPPSKLLLRVFGTAVDQLSHLASPAAEDYEVLSSDGRYLCRKISGGTGQASSPACRRAWRSACSKASWGETRLQGGRLWLADRLGTGCRRRVSTGPALLLLLRRWRP